MSKKHPRPDKTSKINVDIYFLRQVRKALQGKLDKTVKNLLIQQINEMETKENKRIKTTPKNGSIHAMRLPNDENLQDNPGS